MKFSCPVILASASPRRKDLLSGMGVVFTVLPAEVEEISQDSGYPASEMVRLNACLKAGAVARLHPEALVIGSDTVVVCGGEIFGKPHSPEEAVSMLKKLSGRAHQVMSGVSLECVQCHLDHSFTEISEVVFKKLDVAAIREYMRLVNVMDKAGAYAIQEHPELILDRLEGSLSNVIGLPAERLGSELIRLGREFNFLCGA
jgi:septum formation protein